MPVCVDSASVSGAEDTDDRKEDVVDAEEPECTTTAPASVTMGEDASAIQGMPTTTATLKAPNRLAPLPVPVAAVQKDRRSISFGKGHQPEGGTHGRSSRVMPVLHSEYGRDHDDHDGRSHVSGQSRMTVSSLHRAIQAGLKGEDPVLTLLRHLLLVMCVSVIGLSLATVVTSGSVVSTSMLEAESSFDKGERARMHQVRMCWFVCACECALVHVVRALVREMSA